MRTIRDVECRAVLNSHVEFTPEFSVVLDDGSRGTGSSAEGETVSVYEGEAGTLSGNEAVDELRGDGLVGRGADQRAFDAYLDARIPLFGRNTCFALSLALRNALTAAGEEPRPTAAPPREPRICLNLLNGGRHAYTNPVLCDWPEILVVAPAVSIRETIEEHAEIQRRLQDGLSRLPEADVGGNRVRCFAVRDNRACLDFVVGILDGLGVSDRYGLMIDASAGDLLGNTGYVHSITDGATRSSGELVEYWTAVCDAYGVRYLEDPFAERDESAWRALRATGGGSLLLGDNLYASDAERIARGAASGLSDGVVVKPNQSGTVTGVERAVAAAHDAGMLVVTSHRSKSTESTFLSELTCAAGADCVKIGPLLTDYSSVVRLNEIIRLTGAERCP